MGDFNFLNMFYKNEDEYIKESKESELYKISTALAAIVYILEKKYGMTGKDFEEAMKKSEKEIEQGLRKAYKDVFKENKDGEK